jgi:hypothetical protein
MNRGATVKGNYKRHWISSDAIGEANGIRTGLFFLPSDHKRLSVFRWQSNLTASSNPGSDNMLHSMTWRHFVCCWSPTATLRGLSLPTTRSCTTRSTSAWLRHDGSSMSKAPLIVNPVTDLPWIAFRRFQQFVVVLWAWFLPCSCRTYTDLSVQVKGVKKCYEDLGKLWSPKAIKLNHGFHG